MNTDSVGSRPQTGRNCDTNSTRRLKTLYVEFQHLSLTLSRFEAEKE